MPNQDPLPPKQISNNELFQLGEDAKGRLSNIILHWTGSPYDELTSDYHLLIDKDGKVYQTCADLTATKDVTPGRDQQSVSIALTGCNDARCDTVTRKVHFGPNPPTPQQLNAMAWVVAILTITLDLEINFANVKTHAEVAILDHYGLASDKDEDDRVWDLLWIPSEVQGERHLGGPILREMALHRAKRILNGNMHLEQIPLFM